MSQKGYQNEIVYDTDSIVFDDVITVNSCYNSSDGIELTTFLGDFSLGNYLSSAIKNISSSSESSKSSKSTRSHNSNGEHKLYDYDEENSINENMNIYNDAYNDINSLQLENVSQLFTALTDDDNEKLVNDSIGSYKTLQNNKNPKIRSEEIEYPENYSISPYDNQGITYSNRHVFIDTHKYYPIVNKLSTVNGSVHRRKVPKRNKYIVACTLLLTIFLFVLWSYRLITFTLNHLLYNLLWMPITIVSIFILLFPSSIIVGGCFNIFGSTEFFFTNSKYYSCSKEILEEDQCDSARCPQTIVNDLNDTNKLTFVTIQIPVYKEDFNTVIKPTLKSAMLCKKYYEHYPEHNVRVNIFVCDDGLQVLDELEVHKRISFYNLHSIGYVGRPPKDRAGKFKKASNLNFGIAVSKIFMELNKKLTQDDAICVTKFLYANSGIHILANNNLTIGDYILLLDSDTRIPVNCLHDVLKEFKIYNDLGYTQHLTYPLIITNTYWEKFIAHFTTLIYDMAMPIAVAGGDVSPLVGHCAILRTSAIKKIDTQKQIDNTKKSSNITNQSDHELYIQKIWSEDNVSEDFKMFMDLTALGYYGRYITYTSDTEKPHFEKYNFMEGISLEYNDELAKFKKYSYGTCEMLFNPVRDWCRKGLIGKTIIQYCKSNTEVTSKIGIISYLFTYVAIGISLPMSYVNYFIFGWFHDYIDTQVLPLHVVLQVAMLFSGLGTFANSVFKARVLRKDAINVLWYNLIQTPFYTLFFGSLPFHIVIMMFKYFAGYENITWGSTRKEIVYSSKWNAIISTLYEFKVMYVVFSSTIVIIILLSTTLVPENWRITKLNAITPLIITSILHLCGPLLLNPYVVTNSKLKMIVDNDNNEHNLNFFINNQ